MLCVTATTTPTQKKITDLDPSECFIISGKRQDVAGIKPDDCNTFFPFFLKEQPLPDSYTALPPRSFACTREKYWIQTNANRDTLCESSCQMIPRELTPIVLFARAVRRADAEDLDRWDSYLDVAQATKDCGLLPVGIWMTVCLLC